QKPSTVKRIDRIDAPNIYAVCVTTERVAPSARPAHSVTMARCPKQRIAGNENPVCEGHEPLRQVGFNPVQYLANKRRELCAEFLPIRQRDLRLVEIVEHDASPFVKAFDDEVGVLRCERCTLVTRF